MVPRPSSFMRHFLHALNVHDRTQYTYEVQESMIKFGSVSIHVAWPVLYKYGVRPRLVSQPPLQMLPCYLARYQRHTGSRKLIMTSCKLRSRRADLLPVTPTQTNRWIFCHWCNIDDWMVVSLKSWITCWECQYCNVNAVENLCWKQHCLCMVKIRECFHC